MRSAARPAWLIQIKARAGKRRKMRHMWQPISSAPFDRDLELAVIASDGPHALVFPCRRVFGGWVNAGTRERIDVHPTHWREWGEDPQSSNSSH
jgi:hypothetical protein